MTQLIHLTLQYYTHTVIVTASKYALITITLITIGTHSQITDSK